MTTQTATLATLSVSPASKNPLQAVVDDIRALPNTTPENVRAVLESVADWLERRHCVPIT